MGVHYAAVRTSNVTTNQALVEIIGSTTKRTVVLGIGIQQASATTGIRLGFGRPAAVGVTPGGLTTVTGEDVNDVGDTQIATTWGTSPTAPAVYMKRYALPSLTTQPNGVVWHFPQGILLGTSGATRSLVVFNITGAAGQLFDVDITVEED